MCVTLVHLDPMENNNPRIAGALEQSLFVILAPIKTPWATNISEYYICILDHLALMETELQAADISEQYFWPAGNK
jgi:hypothetical protein